MISIITGIYNQKSMNELFYQTLVENTYHPFELIIVDNNSTDGSKEFFAQKDNVVLIENNGNYNYPYCQNIGLKKAKHELVCFFNNDILVSSNWDVKVMEILKKEKNIKVLSVATNDHVESKPAQKKIARKWKKIKYPIQTIFGNNKMALKLMAYLMYGEFQKFAEKRFSKWGYQLIEGYSGSAIISTKKFMESIELWDERIQAADYDLFNRVKKISLTDSSVSPIALALGIYFHHFQRLTYKTKFPPFKNQSIMMSLTEKWGKETDELRKDIVG
ncbi:glycosyltransferase [Salegentibacter sp. F188]|uniref:Glycosyltransferase n=1 Tax=Autumnicola patrickiae TaxID=3075591 RepID=A0ABU3DXM9_9FLAO|nr:glycosyltransferase [Salegentibacter sp. F188]MDT0688477.1 glycosyltransferase [Salegentibacter sp. F188]